MANTPFSLQHPPIAQVLVSGSKLYQGGSLRLCLAQDFSEHDVFWCMCQLNAASSALAGREITEPCQAVRDLRQVMTRDAVAATSIFGYDAFGFNDEITVHELATFIEADAPGVVIMSGCASFYAPLQNEFTGEGTKLYVGWTRKVKATAAVDVTQEFVQSLLNGSDIKAALAAANANDLLVGDNTEITLRNETDDTECELIRLQAFYRDGANEDMTIFEILDFEDPN